jgi:hypothetical protein
VRQRIDRPGCVKRWLDCRADRHGQVSCWPFGLDRTCANRRAPAPAAQAAATDRMQRANARRISVSLRLNHNAPLPLVKQNQPASADRPSVPDAGRPSSTVPNPDIESHENTKPDETEPILSAPIGFVSLTSEVPVGQCVPSWRLCRLQGPFLIPILTAPKTRELSETESGSSAPIGFVSFVLSWPQCRFWGPFSSLNISAFTL